MRHILLREDGGVSVMNIADDADPHKEIEKWAESAGQSAKVAGNIDLPDARFRGAWRHDGRSVSIDMTVAKGMAMDAIRQGRASRFEALDLEVNRYILSDPDRAKKAERARQALRDLPQTLGPKIDAATSPDDLLAITAGAIA